jgi:hypothetical protein
MAIAVGVALVPTVTCTAGSDGYPIKYVNVSNATPVAPFSTWVTAATNIQDAVDVAADGDTVLVTNGVYAGGSRVVDGTTNRVVVDKAVRLQSVNGPEATVITGQGTVRCVYLANGPVLSGLTLTGGGGVLGGGGIYGGNAAVSNCIIQGNSPNGGYGRGGGIYSAGDMTLDDCVVRGNNAGYEGTGAGICNTGTMVLNRCVIAGNSSMASGGGLLNSGDMLLVNCIISGNTVYRGGGGIINDGSMILGGCVISTNYSNRGHGGAGILNNGDILLTNCTIIGNWGSHTVNIDGIEGGGVLNTGVAVLRDCSVVGNHSWLGGGIANSGLLAVTNCTIGTNWASNDSGGGGGLWNEGVAILENTTVSGNMTRGKSDLGAGICNRGGLTLISSTVCSNQSPYVSSSMRGGGVYNAGTVISRNCIFAGNSMANGPDFYGTLYSLGFNLLQDTNGCTITNSETGNIYGADPLLGPLQDNGGPTWTHALLPGSPAIDSGGSGGATTDQRGAPRPCDVPEIPNADDGSDIGAYEVITPAGAVRLLMATVEAVVPRSQPLLATLSAALASLERGNPVSAINQLRAFQNQVRAQVSPSDPALAASFIEAAQGVIDVLRGD